MNHYYALKTIKAIKEQLKISDHYIAHLKNKDDQLKIEIQNQHIRDLLKDLIKELK